MKRVTAAVLTDSVLTVYAYAGATALRVYTGAPAEMLDTVLVAMGPFVAVHIGALAIMGAYDLRKTRSESDVAFAGMMGVGLGVVLSFLLATAAIVYYAPSAQPVARSVFVMAGLALFGMVSGWRVWFTRLRRKRGELRSRVLVVGRSESVERVAREIEEYSRSGHDTIGCVHEDPDAQDWAEHGFIGTTADLPELIEMHSADEVLVLGEHIASDADALLRAVDLCERLNVRVHILPGLYEAMVGRLNIYEIGGVPLVEVPRNPMSGPYAYLKRATDIVLSLLGLTVLGPIGILAAIAVKLDSKGPVFYRQLRMGLNGREFYLTKLRTMRVDAEKDTGPVLALEKDPRVTRVGDFLRRKRLDEIPQLLNVIKGDMSLVGPRPERKFFYEKFAETAPLFKLRLRVKPGLTALSHVWGRYNSEPNDRLRYDLVYMSNMSLWLDIRIMIETAKIMITGRGAR